MALAISSVVRLKWPRSPTADSASIATSSQRRVESERSSSKSAALAVMEKLKTDDPTDRDVGKQLAAWEKIRAFTVEQCLDALDANGEKATPENNNEAACMLYYRLGELAPEVALKSVWALPSPFKAAGYVSTISDPERRGNAIKILKTLWTDTDAVNAWLETLPAEDRGRVDEK